MGMPKLQPSVDNYKELNTFVDTAFGNVTDVYKKGIEASKLYDDFVSQLRTMLDSWKANPSMDEMTRQLGLVVLKVLAISKVETKSSATLNEDGEALQGYLNKFEWHKKSLTTSLTNTINETKKLAGWPAQIQKFKTSSLEICQQLRSLFNPGQGNGANDTKTVMHKIAKILQETSGIASKSEIVQDEKLNGYQNPPAFNPEYEEQKNIPKPVLVASPTIIPKKAADDSPSRLSHNKDSSNSNSHNDSPNRHSPLSQKGLFSPSAGIYVDDLPPPSYDDAKNDPTYNPKVASAPLAPLTASQVNAANRVSNPPVSIAKSLASVVQARISISSSVEEIERELKRVENLYQTNRDVRDKLILEVDLLSSGEAVAALRRFDALCEDGNGLEDKHREIRNFYSKKVPGKIYPGLVNIFPDYFKLPDAKSKKTHKKGCVIM